MLAEMGAGAGVMLVHDALIAGLDYGLFESLLSAGSGGGVGGVIVAALGALILITVLDFVDLIVAPFAFAGVEYGVSRAYDDTGGRYWKALLGAYLGQGAALAVALVLSFVVDAIPGASTASNSQSTLIGFLVASELVRLIAVPVATSYALHWGQAVVPELAATPPPMVRPPNVTPSTPSSPGTPNSEPPTAPTTPNLPEMPPTSWNPTPPPAMTVNLLAIQFG
jgi:hypothetical protein